MSDLPPIPEESFDGEKISVELKEIKCTHEPLLVDAQTLRCTKCSAGWFGPNITRLYEAMKHGQSN